jgi:hypothetical protein
LATYLDNFTSRTLDLTFYFLRTPYKAFHSLAARPGFLRVNANSYALGDRDAPALLLRKQTSYDETFETELEFTPRNNLTEAGVTIFYSDLLHNDIGIVGDGNGGRRIVARTSTQATQVGPWALVYTNSTITKVKDVCYFVEPELTVVTGVIYSTNLLGSRKIQNRRQSNFLLFGIRRGRKCDIYVSRHHRFCASVCAASWVRIMRSELDFYRTAVDFSLCRSFAFKGTAFGVYNTGNGKPSLAPADFAYWKQTPGKAGT